MSRLVIHKDFLLGAGKRGPDALDKLELKYDGRINDSFNIQGSGFKLDGKSIESGIHKIKHGQVIEFDKTKSLNVSNH